MLVTTRRAVVLFLRRHPGVTVAELAAELHVSGKAIRRHLGLLRAEGLVRMVPGPRPRAGRPASGWELTAEGCAVLPHCYERLALDLLDDVADSLGADALEALLQYRGANMAERYRSEMIGSETLTERVHALAALRDREGYLACAEACGEGSGGGVRLIEHHCAVEAAASRHPGLCAMELALVRQALGPSVEVQRERHLLSGDSCCSYRVRPRSRA